MSTFAKCQNENPKAKPEDFGKIYLAPMEGVVDAVMRDILTRIGGFDQCVTEFVRVTDRPVPPAVFLRYCPELQSQGRTESGVPVFVQLLGGQPQPMAENAARAASLGAPGIDINFGCPAKTVNRHDGGAALLKSPQRLYDVISAIRKSVPSHIPVTAKVRLGFDSKDLCVEIAKAVDEAKASRLTVHARTKVEGYRPPAHWEFIAQMREVVSVPVVANGDIWSLNDYIRCREVTGCKDVALGRGVIACPDLARQIKNYIEGEEYRPLTWHQVRYDILPYFFSESRDYKTEDFAVSRMKQWTKLVGREYPEAKDLFENIKRLKGFDEIDQIVRSEKHSPPAVS